MSPLFTSHGKASIGGAGMFVGSWLSGVVAQFYSSPQIKADGWKQEVAYKALDIISPITNYFAEIMSGKNSHVNEAHSWSHIWLVPAVMSAALIPMLIPCQSQCATTPATTKPPLTSVD